MCNTHQVSAGQTAACSWIKQLQENLLSGQDLAAPQPPQPPPREGNLGRRAGSKSELLWPDSQQGFEIALKPSEIPSPVPINLRDDTVQP